MRLAYAPYRLQFKEPAGTSRGVMQEKVTCLLKVWDEKEPEIFGVGEAAVFDGLSPEADARYEYKLVELLANIALGRPTDLSRHSSIQFGLEQAFRDFASGGRGIYFPSEFSEGKKEIEINGLVWMGNLDMMLERLHKKIKEGFHCIKLKIGAISWDEELLMLKEIRKSHDGAEVIIRVDANGGFTFDDAMPRLRELAGYDIHSIEQPIAARHYEEMKILCRESPVPIALDEDLIGVYSLDDKRRLLDYVHPQYIILKPALCGGFSGAEEWMALAKDCGIGYWATSALESNVGLTALAQWVGQREDLTGAQGLGTGALFTNNFVSPLKLDGEWLSQPVAAMDHDQFKGLDWRE